ncbi:MAG: 2-succinyl-5-enolpyruvyl-6-hydroxy-3-cyclohexene-1-carboxylic-acid synthase [Cytophagales bacterium]|nr:MAG: 2-succinyl-5-enolpyruvyl-6-hydroxy-3-cyclohexene-1-carboxylic-acid synthase [Cytophagales bacterium]
MFPSHVAHLVALLYQKNVRQVVLSPGSRVAPLTLAFVRHGGFEVYTMSDERSAAFMALGLAQKKLKDFETEKDNALCLVALACTSGTAVLNYAPAVAEAFYQEIPLIVLTADRPPEWIDQQDGQAIRQMHVYGAHVKKSVDIAADTYMRAEAIWYMERLCNESIQCAIESPRAAVHFNLPFREPFYPDIDEIFTFPSSSQIRTIQKIIPPSTLSTTVWETLFSLWEQAERKMIVAAQMFPSERLKNSLQRIVQEYKIPLIADTVANLHTIEGTIQAHELILFKPDATFRPDLLITFGKSLIAKPLKMFLRQYQPKWHIHIQEGGWAADTFQTLTHQVAMCPASFFEQWYEALEYQYKLEDENEENEAFFQRWQTANQRAMRYLWQEFNFKGDFSALAATKIILDTLPNVPLHLHVANSMAVRYLNYWGIERTQTELTVFANRGTSGIEGSSSTAVGCALADRDTLTLLITGDLAFFYDRNAFWHNYPLPNLRIIVLNDQGGGIFRIIKGPREQPELDEFFETKQMLNASLTSQDFMMDYTKVDNEQDLKNALTHFFEPHTNAKILEIAFDSTVNAEAVKKMLNNYQNPSISL